VKKKIPDPMQRYTLYLSHAQLNALKKKSAETHIVVSELIRMAVADALVTGRFDAWKK